MDGGPVELRVGGQTYRVRASADEDELRRLAEIVDSRLEPHRKQAHGHTVVAPQALLLAAMTLAHELEQERERRRQVEQRAREMLSHVLERVDAALDATEANDSVEAVSDASRTTESPSPDQR